MCAGIFLPVISCINGILSLQPKHYNASQHDVIRLSPNLSDMWGQQGYVCCQPDGLNRGAHNLHFTLKVSQARGGRLRNDVGAYSLFCLALSIYQLSVGCLE